MPSFLMRADLGTQLGQYRIERRVGGDLPPEVTGGRLSAGLYLARDTEHDLRVALRILPRFEFNDPGRMQRIVQRTKAALTLKHRNVASIYNIGAASGEWFVATEYVHGKSLDDRIAGYPLSAAEIAAIAIQVTDALVHAHGHGIVHGDITPFNIMLTPGGQVKLLNFGVGQELTDDMLTWTDFCDEDLVQLVRYISPEQLMNREEDSRSDLFSLGIVLYEMATGRQPFRASSELSFPLAAAQYEMATGQQVFLGQWPLNEYYRFVLARVTCEQPEAVARLNAGIPAELGHIIHRCLEKDLWRRYQSARDLGVDLNNALSDLGQVFPKPAF
jgi:serine/threonine protein kinase